MRKPVLALMTGLTALVVGLGIRAGGSPDSVTVAGAAGAGRCVENAKPPRARADGR